MSDLVTLPSIHLKHNSVSDSIQHNNSDVISPRLNSIRRSEPYTRQLAEHRYNQYVQATGHHIIHTNKSIPVQYDTHHVNHNIQQFERMHNVNVTTEVPAHINTKHTHQYVEEEKTETVDVDRVNTDILINKLAEKLSDVSTVQTQNEYTEQLHNRAAQIQSDIHARRLNAASAAATIAGNDIDIINIHHITSSTEQQLNDSVWRSSQHALIYNANSKLMFEQIASEQERIRKLELAQAQQHANDRQAEFQRTLMYNIQRVQSAVQHKRHQQHNGNVDFCHSVVSKLIDVSCQIATYRQTTDHSLVPQAMYNQWISTLHTHHSTDNQSHIHNSNMDNSTSNHAFNQYVSCTLEWSHNNTPLYYVTKDIIDAHPVVAPETVHTDKCTLQPGVASRQPSTNVPTTAHIINNNDLLGAVVKRLFDIESGVLLKPDQPVIPAHPLSICLIGKPYSGKSTLAHYLTYKYGVQVIDAETLVTDAVSSYELYIKSNNKSKPIPMTVQQQLGQKLKKSLIKNSVVTDDIYVSLIKYQVDTCTTGYVVVNFPTTLQQAKLVETALSGYVESKPVRHGPPNTTTDKNERIQSNIAKPSKTITATTSNCIPAFHCVIDVSATDEQCMSNMLKQTTEQHINATVASSTLPAFILHYNEIQPTLHAWYNKFNNLHILDLNQPTELLKDTTRTIIQTVLQQMDNNKDNIDTIVPDGIIDNNNTTTVSTDVRPYDNFNDITVHDMYDLSISSLLTRQWQLCEHTYTTDISSILDQRYQHIDTMMSHIQSIRTTYIQHIQSVDNNKQQLIHKFVHTFNSMPNTVRQDVTVKNELHMRTDELCDQLFTCTQNKQKQCEQLIVQLMCDNWLDSQCTLIQTHYIALCQTEIYRYVTTLNIIVDYFTACSTGVLNSGSVLEINPKHTISNLINDTTSRAEKNKTSRTNHNNHIKTNKNDATIVRPTISPYHTHFSDVIQHVHDNVLITADWAVNAVQTRITDHINANTNKSKRKPTKPTTADQVSSVTPYQQLLNQQLTAIILQENHNLQARIQLIQRNCECEIVQLRLYYVHVFIERLDEWLGQRIKAESQAIDTLANTIQQSIQQEQPIYHKLLLNGEDVIVDRDVILQEIPCLKQRHIYSHTASTDSDNQQR